ncbi:hypothetical protein MKK75_26515 [Methylobacterium sp. J-030]|nr:hypothetical protein [Methylobacterium sp. J-030]MCJ2072304.1 hypothetical protein [Methylobacterium sp. J-030]
MIVATVTADSRRFDTRALRRPSRCTIPFRSRKLVRRRPDPRRKSRRGGFAVGEDLGGEGVEVLLDHAERAGELPHDGVEQVDQHVGRIVDPGQAAAAARLGIGAEGVEVALAHADQPRPVGDQADRQVDRHVRLKGGQPADQVDRIPLHEDAARFLDLVQLVRAEQRDPERLGDQRTFLRRGGQEIDPEGLGEALPSLLRGESVERVQVRLAAGEGQDHGASVLR